MPGTQPVQTFPVTAAGGVVLNATLLANGDIVAPGTTVHPNQLVHQSSQNASMSIAGTGSLASPSAAITGGGYGNVSVDECFSSWESYWSQQTSQTSSYKATLTYTTTFTRILDSTTGSYFTFTTVIEDASTTMAGGFAIGTSSTQYTTTVTDVGIEPESGTTYTATNTFTTGSWVQPSSLRSPSCKLPKMVTKCEQKWESWITEQLAPWPTPRAHCDLKIGLGYGNNNTTPACASSYYASTVDNINSPNPACTQASIPNALCSSVRENYVSGLNYNFQNTLLDEYIGAFSGSTFVYYDGTRTTSTWPSSSTIGGPGCTLGCGRCAVTGGTVQLLYWPPATADANVTAPANAPVTTVWSGTTLTSPTIYVSYGSAYAKDGFGKTIGSLIENTIVAIPPEQPLSSVWGFPMGCDAHFRAEGNVITATAPFTVEDLYRSPVPDSIFTSQPRCATEMFCGGPNATCDRTRPYEPVIVVPQDILQQMQPEWADCYGDIR